MVALLALSGLLMGVAHIRPIRPLACLALLIAAAWIESACAHWRPLLPGGQMAG